MNWGVGVKSSQGNQNSPLYLNLKEDLDENIGGDKMLTNIAKILPFFVVKFLYKKLSGENLKEVHLNSNDWKVFWLDSETILLVRK